MIKLRCISKIRDGRGKIIGYKLGDSFGNVKDVVPKELKQAIVAKKVEVVNLKLTSDFRLVDCNDTVVLDKNFFGLVKHIANACGYTIKKVDAEDMAMTCIRSTKIPTYMYITSNEHLTEFSVCFGSDTQYFEFEKEYTFKYKSSAKQSDMISIVQAMRPIIQLFENAHNADDILKLNSFIAENSPVLYESCIGNFDKIGEVYGVAYSDVHKLIQYKIDKIVARKYRELCEKYGTDIRSKLENETFKDTSVCAGICLEALNNSPGDVDLFRNNSDVYKKFSYCTRLV